MARREGGRDRGPDPLPSYPMTDDRLFDLDSIPEVPLIREARRSRGEHDARFRNDYPADWSRCELCDGTGGDEADTCPRCLGMGSLKARVRFDAGHRCERCCHPFVTKGDAKMLGVQPSGGRWSRCDRGCMHSGPYRVLISGEWVEGEFTEEGMVAPRLHVLSGNVVEAEWRVLTVHHLDGDKANSAWWNLAVLCQRCHLEIQAKVVMERVYPHEHSEWFKPHAAGYYAEVYLHEQVTRKEALDRLDELLGLEYDPALNQTEGD